MFYIYGSYSLKYDLNVDAVRRAVSEAYAADQSSGVQQEPTDTSGISNVLIIAFIVCASTAAVLGVIVAIICCCKTRKSAKEMSECDYPGYGSMEYDGSKAGGERKIAQSAQMYHYQHQKQQILDLEKSKNAYAKSGSETGSDDGNEGDEYTVYECPGLATSGDLEVPNPLFSEPTAGDSRPEVRQQPAENLVNGYKDP